MLVTFSGLHGSGKSTFVQRTVNYLKDNGIRVKTVAVYKISLFSILGYISDKISKKSTRVLVDAQFSQEITIRKRILGAVRRVCFLVDVLIFTLLYIFPSRIGRYWVVCDRYFIDSIVQLKYLNMCSDRFYELSTKIIPSPEIPIFLSVEPEVARQRRPEYKRDYFEMKAKLYRDIIKKLGGYVILSNDLNQTQSEIEGILRKRMTL